MEATDLDLANLAAVEEQVASLMKDIVITAQSLVAVAKVAMEVVENVQALAGPQKKAMVLQVVRRLVEKHQFEDAAQRLLCLSLLDSGVLDAAVDLTISAAKGGIMVNTPLRKGGCACVLC
jgi:hypothetical protein